MFSLLDSTTFPRFSTTFSFYSITSSEDYAIILFFSTNSMSLLPDSTTSPRFSTTFSFYSITSSEDYAIILFFQPTLCSHYLIQPHKQTKRAKPALSCYLFSTLCFDLIGCPFLAFFAFV